MPAAAIGAGIGGAGSLASGIGSKKMQNKLTDLANQQLGLQKQQIGLGNAALGNASNFWNALLHGGQAAVQATGPIASQIGQAAQGARNSIQATMPRGGEQNLALAQNYNQASSDIARLYAGMQPMAAQSLAQIGGEYFLPGGQASPYAAMGALGQNLGFTQGALGGFGNTLYNSLSKLANRGTQWSPVTNDPNATVPIFGNPGSGHP